MIMSSEISKFLNKKIKGNDIEINGFESIKNIKNNKISFVNKNFYDFDFSVHALIIVKENFPVNEKSNCSFIYSPNPRLDYIKVLNKFFVKKKKSGIADTVKIGEGCKISKDVIIGDYTIVKNNVEIGAGTIINNHVVIESNTIIGNNCYIKSGAILGEDGFGFERDDNNVPLKFPHFGNVIIGDNVEIGAKVTIARASMDSTIINNDVKIDDQVHIAHNCFIGESTLITACVELSGSVIIGKNCWVGPNSSIKDGVIIQDNSFVGIGCNVSSDLNQNEKIGSFSNLSLRQIVRLKKLLDVQ